jgi:hypothetical protein
MSRDLDSKTRHYNVSILWMALILVLPTDDPKLPGTFYRIPEQIREKATVVVAATFEKGRTPCMWRPDGTRVWAVDASFEIRTVYRGKIGSRFIRVNAAMLPKSEYVAKRLEVKREYLVLLQPGADKLKAINTKEGISFWDSLRNEEILAIIEIER